MIGAFMADLRVGVDESIYYSYTVTVDLPDASDILIVG